MVNIWELAVATTLLPVNSETLMMASFGFFWGIRPQLWLEMAEVYSWSLGGESHGAWGNFNVTRFTSERVGAERVDTAMWDFSFIIILRSWFFFIIIIIFLIMIFAI